MVVSETIDTAPDTGQARKSAEFARIPNCAVHRNKRTDSIA
jgi:hypothetical protein